MMWLRRRLPVLVTLAIFVGVGCGGGGGGGGGTAAVSGQVTSASTSRIETPRGRWLAWIEEEVVGFARRVYAAATDTSLGGITVTVTSGGRRASDATDSEGNFALNDAPSGDVMVTFERGRCGASVSLNDVVDSSRVALQGTTVNCDNVSPGTIEETFQAVLENKPASPNGNLNVCAFTAGRNHRRAVKTDSSTQYVNIDGSAATFDDLQEGDLLEAVGTREGLGTNSALDASGVRRIAAGRTGQCQALPSPTPTSTPTATATP